MVHNLLLKEKQMTLEESRVQLQGILDIKLGKNVVSVGASKDSLVVYEHGTEQYRFLKKFKGYSITYKKVGKVIV